MFAIGLVLFVIAMILDGPRHPADEPAWYTCVPGVAGCVLMFIGVVVWLWRVMP